MAPSIGNIAGIVPVAGLSSRMDGFKPLLRVNGFPMIRMTAASLIDGGASPICVVLGKDDQDVRQALADIRETNIIFACNRDFAHTDMLESVRIGIRRLLEWEASSGQSIDAFFLLPGDVPLVSPSTFRLVAKTMAQTGADVVKPMMGQRGAHPPLISHTLFEKILSFDGDGGLRTIFAEADMVKLPINDDGALLDADTHKEMAQVIAYARSHKGVSEDILDELFEKAQTPQNVREHCRTTEGLCRRMAQNLNSCRYALDTELCASGAAMHDLMRIHPKHGRLGAQFLEEQGYDAIARIVLEHDGFFGVFPEDFTESSIVCFADKFVQNDQLVSIEQRYAKALEKYGENTMLRNRMELDMMILNHMKERYEKLTGDKLP